ncbi:MAG: cytochrome C554 [Melioribacteraceae bacterium]|nr:cytochrome C554 [Melioribacteraceae bacterium]
MLKGKIFSIFTLCVILLLSFSSDSFAQKAHEFVGVKTCGMCHKKAEDGEQLKIWEKSAHANAYKTLTTAKAEEVAKKAGIKGKASEAKECLMCHATAYDVDKKLIGKKFKLEEGIQCESCHGAGSDYKKKKVMQDHAKAVATGMTEYKDDAAIEKQCITCHNEKSPTFKKFDFAKRWAEIKHPTPKK